MGKRVNEIFYSLQGEGRNSGRAATFVRFAGCNLRCPFCDTDFSSFTEMTDSEIVAAALSFPTRFVVITGGEPSLQLDEPLINMFHSNGFTIAIETNGTRPLPAGIDWVTVSPKQSFLGLVALLVVRRCDELKIVFDGEHEVNDYGIEATHYYLQPCDTGDSHRNQQICKACVNYILHHPQWQLSLQTHKLIGFR